MTLDELDHWLRRYGRAWQKGGPEDAAALFTEDALYAWGPFSEPLRGVDAIRRRWHEATSAQRDIRFEHEPLAVTADGRGIALWRVTYVAPARRTRFRHEGIFLVTLAPDGRCSEFREWWNSEEEPLESPA